MRGLDQVCGHREENNPVIGYRIYLTPGECGLPTRYTHSPPTPTPHMGEHCTAEDTACTHSFVTLRQLCFGSRVLVRSVPAVRPLIYLLTYLLNLGGMRYGPADRTADRRSIGPCIRNEGRAPPRLPECRRRCLDICKVPLRSRSLCMRYIWARYCHAYVLFPLYDLEQAPTS